MRGPDLVALARVEHEEEPRAARGRALGAVDLDLAVDDDDVGALVDLVVLQALAGREVDDDRPRLAARGVQDCGLVRRDVERAQVPVLHAGAEPTPRRGALHADGGPARLGVGEVVHRRAARPSAATRSLKSCGRVAAFSACSIVTRPAFRCSNSAWSNVCMP